MLFNGKDTRVTAAKLQLPHFGHGPSCILGQAPEKCRGGSGGKLQASQVEREWRQSQVTMTQRRHPATTETKLQPLAEPTPLFWVPALLHKVARSHHQALLKGHKT